MDRDGVSALYQYNAYANNLVLDTAARLSEAEFIRVSSPSHGSVRGLLMHMLDSEAFFLAVCTGRPQEELSGPSTFAGLRQTWDQLAKETREYLAALSDADLMEEIEVPIGSRSVRITRWQALTQGIVHSTHHRGELSIALTELGYPLPTLDIILQFVEQSGQEWPQQSS